MSRLSISMRLAVLSAASLTALVALLGVAAYYQLGAGLRAGVDQQLVNSAAALPESGVTGLGVVEDDRELAGVELSEQLVQIVDARGDVTAASDELDADVPLVDAATLAQVRGGRTVLRTVDEHEDSDEQLRVLAVPYGDDGGVALVAVDLEEVDEAKQALLAVYGPLGIAGSVLAGMLGYLSARRSLRPVRRMTAEAEAIGAADLSQRLSQPAQMDEVGRLTRTLNGMLARLEAGIERERTFAADASHELRTPLAILRAEVELARQRVHDQSARSSLDTALHEAVRLSGLVDDLLLLARADSGHAGDHRPLDLDDLAGQVADRFATLASRKHVRLNVHGAAVVRGDASGLERAIGNLLDNALRHTPEGGEVGIEIQPVEANGADVVVTDTGPGVPADRLAVLFERFSRLDDARHEPGGAGLGLAIVAAIAAAHSGTVTATNRRGGGLAVTLAIR